MKECDIILSYEANCNTVLDVYEASGRGDTLETPPLGFIAGIDQYCYKAIARSQTFNFNLTVEGIIYLQHSSPNQTQTQTQTKPYTPGPPLQQNGNTTITLAIAAVGGLYYV